jgi:hypothetical protein
LEGRWLDGRARLQGWRRTSWLKLAEGGRASADLLARLPAHVRQPDDRRGVNPKPSRRPQGSIDLIQCREKLRCLLQVGDPDRSQRTAGRASPYVGLTTTSCRRQRQITRTGMIALRIVEGAAPAASSRSA